MKAPKYMGRSTSECLYINPNAGKSLRRRFSSGGFALRMEDAYGH